MSNGLSFINNRIESILGKIRRVFVWEIFNPRTFGGGKAKLQMGPGLVATSFDKDMRTIEIEKFIAMLSPRNSFRLGDSGFGEVQRRGLCKLGNSLILGSDNIFDTYNVL